MRPLAHDPLKLFVQVTIPDSDAAKRPALEAAAATARSGIAATDLAVAQKAAADTAAALK